MFGDLFLFMMKIHSFMALMGFRPHVWGSFFICFPMILKSSSFVEFSSPCLGIFFYDAIMAMLAKNSKFSSPCLGIFFYDFPTNWGKVQMNGKFSSPCLGIFFYSMSEKAHPMGLRGAICGGDRSWDTWGSLLRNSSADFLRTHGHRRGFDEKVAPDFEGSKGSEVCQMYA